ncbi:MAG TPA: IclR family transcriptional regulator [Gammaproteobacteria bacterium]|nr:IclR family transcriptional regulator [Gammaproteobacteria bacterium]
MDAKAGRTAESDAPADKLVGALVTGLRVLRYLAASGSAIGVTRIARELDLHASTCFNVLKTLVHEELVIFDEDTKTYSIGLGLVELAKGALEQASLVRMLRPHLEAIANAHRVTATLWHRSSKDRVTLVDLADTSATIRVHMSIGQRLPMYIAALGRCMAAYSELTEEQLRKRIAELRWEDAPTFDEYYAEVKRVRERGYAIDDGNYVKGVTTVSAPVVDSNNRAIMALSAVGLSAQLNKTAIRQLGEDLHTRTSNISRALSGRPRA